MLLGLGDNFVTSVGLAFEINTTSNEVFVSFRNLEAIKHTHTSKRKRPVERPSDNSNHFEK